MRAKEGNRSQNIIELHQPHPILLDLENAERYEEEYSIPREDILLISLNLSGLKYSGPVSKRGRFMLTMPNNNSYFLALTITETPLSPFSHDGKAIYLGSEFIAEAGEIEEDTCADSYWRKGGLHLTLNSNSRSKCRGCEFCGTYNLEDDDEALISRDALQRKAYSLCEKIGSDMSRLASLGIVTGCFPNEDELFDHLTLVREVFTEFGFGGEVRYIGSQLRSTDKIKQLTNSGPFAYYLTVEAFERRDQLMKRTKASLDIESGIQLLHTAKNLGAETSFLYIAGLDTKESMKSMFPRYQGAVTRFPLVQTFQVYIPEQIQLRDPDANKLDYYLQARKTVESCFPDLYPDGSANYRSLWYSTYGNKELERNNTI